MIYVLDSSAMIAWLVGETGADAVDAALRDPDSLSCAHSINLCEVFYDALRRNTETDADAAITDIKLAGVIERSDFDESFWKEVGKLKATFRASLADFCGVALTNRVGGTLLTADHHEFDRLAAANVCTVKFIR